MQSGVILTCLAALALDLVVRQQTLVAARVDSRLQPAASREASRRLQATDSAAGLPSSHSNAHTTRSHAPEHTRGTIEGQGHLAGATQHNGHPADKALERLKNAQAMAAQMVRQLWQAPRNYAAWDKALQEFKQRQAACTQENKKPGKYVLVAMDDSFAGLGNQLPSVVSGFLMALLSQRCFFIDFNFYHKTFSPGMDLDWNNNVRRLKAYGHDVEEDPPKLLKAWVGEDITPWITRDQKDVYNEHYGVMIEGDPDYTGALFAANPKHTPLLRTLFPTGEMFHPISKVLFKAKVHISDQVQEFKRKNFRLYTVGIQIRRLKCYEGELSISCKALPAVENFVSVALSLQRAMNIPDKEFRVFVAADMVESYSEVMKLLGPLAIYREDNGVGSVATKVIGTDNPSTPESALIDMTLLSECNALAVTVGSSYGSVAAGMGGIVPIQMIHGYHLDVQNPYWYKAINSEPCYFKGNIFLNNKDRNAWGKLSDSDWAVFKSNPFWMQYVQCHCAE